MFQRQRCKMTMVTRIPGSLELYQKKRGVLNTLDFVEGDEPPQQYVYEEEEPQEESAEAQKYFTLKEAARLARLITELDEKQEEGVKALQFLCNSLISGHSHKTIFERLEEMNC